MLRILSTPNTSVSPSATMNSHDASIRPSTMMVSTRFISYLSPQAGRGELSVAASGQSKPLIALRAGHAALDPVQRLDARRRVDAFGGEILDVDQIDALGIRIVFGAAESDRLDRLMAVGELHLDQAAGRLPFQARHRRGQFIGGWFLAAVRGHRLFHS